MDFSITGILAHFTPVTWLIFWVLVIMSVLSVTVAINRGVVFWRARNQSKIFAETVASSLSGGDVEKVLKQAAQEEYRSAYLARIVRDGLVDARDLGTHGEPGSPRRSCLNPQNPLQSAGERPGLPAVKIS